MVRQVTENTEMLLSTFFYDYVTNVPFYSLHFFFFFFEKKANESDEEIVPI